MIDFNLTVLARERGGRKRETHFMLGSLESERDEDAGVRIWSTWHDREWVLRDAHADQAYARSLDLIRRELAAAHVQLFDAYDEPVRIDVPVDRDGLIDWANCQRKGFYWIFNHGLMSNAAVHPFPPWSFDGWMQDESGSTMPFCAMVSSPVRESWGGYRCRIYSSIGRGDQDIHGRTADECYGMAFEMLRFSLDRRNWKAIDAEGRPVKLSGRFVWSPRHLPPLITPADDETPKQRTRRKRSGMERTGHGGP